jgi:hypothetical protein
MMQTLVFDPNGDITLIMSERDYLDKESESGDDLDKEIVKKESEPDDCLDKKIVERERRMLVSSKHLMLASSVFVSMLQGNFKEGQALRSKGFLELPLPEDDPVAFTVILYIIHGRSRQVPREVNLELLTHISILVDKYQLQEVVAVYSENWIKQLEPEVPKGLTEDSTAWLSTFWVFGHADLFKQTTRILARECDDVIDIENLPIPTAIIGMHRACILCDYYH